MANRVIADAITRASAALDRRALRFMERAMSKSSRGRAPRDARRRLLDLGARYRGGADRFFPEPPPAEVTETPPGPRGARRIGGARAIDLSFPSTYPTHLPEYRDEHARYAENLTAHARWYHGGDRRPVVFCLHGWGGGAYWLEERAFVVPYLLRIGLDVMLFQLPFHGQRAPRQAPRSGALFPSAHVVRTNEAFGQAVWDLRALSAWLRVQGAPAVGVMGMSLGGYTTALWASVDPSLAFAVPMIPAVSMSALMWRHGKGSPQRRRAERMGIDQPLLDGVFEVHSPLARPVQLPRERLLVVAGRGDRITPPDQAEALWRHWGEPEIHWFAGGHLAQVGRGDAFRRVRALVERTFAT